MVTIDYDGGGAAAPLGHHIVGHAGVVGCVREASLLDDQVMVNGYQEVGVQCWVDCVFVLQPVDLQVKKSPDCM